MSQTSSTAPAPTARRASTLDRPTLMRLAETEYERFATLLSSLADDDWDRPTECPGWTVRDVAGHALGMAEMAATVRAGLRQQVAAMRRGGVFIDALTGLQVDEHAGLTAQEVTGRYHRVGPRAARARRRTPGLLRGLPVPMPQDVGGRPETWTFGFLLDTILTRDPWMHRVDISRATERPLVLTADHDGVLVADVVTEWAGRHGQPCDLVLTGPAGGSWTFGDGGPRLQLDAVDFCRLVSGRGQATGLLTTQVPF